MTRDAVAPLERLDPRLAVACEAILRDALVAGASVAVVVGDREYHHAYGVRSVARGAPVTIDTQFNIGSCSKAFTSALIAALVAKGKLNWDDPITRHVPEFVVGDPTIAPLVTLRDLSANRLGLPRVGLTEFGLDPAKPAEYLFERIRHTPFVRPFRDRFGYVNAGHSANAVAAARVTNRSFLDALREHILAPIGASGVTGGAAARTEAVEAADWHAEQGGRLVRVDPIYTDQYLGSGGMVVNGRQALRWLRFQLSAGEIDGVRIMPSEALLETHRPHAVATPGKDVPSLFYPAAKFAAYALGWAVSDFEGRRLVQHSGSDNGVAAHTLLLVDEGIGVAVYGNARTHRPGALAAAYAVAATLLGLPPRDWLAFFQGFVPSAETIEAKASEAPLAAYEGIYEHPADGPLIVVLRDGALTSQLVHGYRLEFVLTPIGGHAFAARPTTPEWSAPGPSGTLTFIDCNGNFSGCDLVVGGVTRPFARCQERARDDAEP